MIQSNPVHQVCNYGSSAVYCASPSPEQIRSGVIPLDSLPASWWNWMWADTNQAVNEAREAVGVFVNELNSVLAAAGICPNCMCLNQLYQAIDKIRTTIGNAVCAGAVKSSSCPGEVSISAEGIMTANCVGNASQLATSARTLVGAVNELKQTYDCCISTINGSITSLGNTKAPICHTSSDMTYGVGSSAEYGHLKITDTFDTCVGGASEGLAVSQAALYNAFTCITGSSATLGNVVACPLGTPSAGICNLAARSDHIHSPVVPVRDDIMDAACYYADPAFACCDKNILSGYYIAECPLSHTDFVTCCVALACQGSIHFQVTLDMLRSPSYTYNKWCDKCGCYVTRVCNDDIRIANCGILITDNIGNPSASKFYAYRATQYGYPFRAILHECRGCTQALWNCTGIPLYTWYMKQRDTTCEVFQGILQPGCCISVSCSGRCTCLIAYVLPAFYTQIEQIPTSAIYPVLHRHL